MRKLGLTKLIAVTMILSSVVTINPTVAHAAIGGAVSTYSWVTNASDFEFNASTGTLVRYNGNDNIVIIPRTINGVAVKTIGYDAFGSKTYLSTVVIPDSVTKIDVSAFVCCNNLRSITLPNSITSIGRDAFSTCNKLESINIDNNYFTSVNGVLYNKSKTVLIAYPRGKKDTSYTIPSTVTTIGQDALANCDNLVNITIPNSVVSIGDFGITYCRNLSNINIPNSVKSIGKNSFESCFSLKKLTVPSSVTSIGDYSFSGNPNMIVYAKNISVKNLLVKAGLKSNQIIVQ